MVTSVTAEGHEQEKKGKEERTGAQRFQAHGEQQVTVGAAGATCMQLAPRQSWRMLMSEWQFLSSVSFFREVKQ